MVAPGTAQPWSQLNMEKESKAADLNRHKAEGDGEEKEWKRKEQNIGASGQDKLCLGHRDGVSWVLETHLTAGTQPKIAAMG